MSSKTEGVTFTILSGTCKLLRRINANMIPITVPRYRKQWFGRVGFEPTTFHRYQLFLRSDECFTATSVKLPSTPQLSLRSQIVSELAFGLNVASSKSQNRKNLMYKSTRYLVEIEFASHHASRFWWNQIGISWSYKTLQL